MNTAILLSGGVGMRLQSEVPKQYIKVSGKMVITYSLATLVMSPLINEIQIVAEHEWREFIIEDANKNGISTEKVQGFAKPGVNRQESILNGLKNILRQKGDFIHVNHADNQDNVMIHDAARPLVTGTQIKDCFAMLHNHECVMPILPMKDTVYYSEDGVTVTKLLERKKIFAGQAPEVFNLKKYYQANINLIPERLNDINGSTEPAVLAGMDIAMIPGDEGNFKITTNADLARFKEIIAQRG